MEYTKEELIEKIKYYADAYYSGREEISDADYDTLIEQLRVLDPENELIAGLAGDEDEAEANAAGYKKVDHILTTGTLSKCMTVEAFKEWSDKHPVQYHVSAKEDGCSMELVYRNGKLAQMISRGNGYIGFDKIPLAKYLNIPQTLDITKDISIRGEFELSNSAFKSHKVFEGLKNPRNAGSGLLNKKESDLTAEEKEAMKEMKFFAYDVRGIDFKQKADIFAFLLERGFTVPENRICNSYDEVLAFREELAKVRGTDEEEYAIDGIVIFENVYDAEDQKEKIQKRAVALKFDLMIARTKLIDIEWSLNGSYLTPIGITEPVWLDGTTVKRAKLCNLSVINGLGIKIGDYVNICKCGEIIPKIISKAD